MNPWISFAISIVALLVSGLLLAVHFVNQRERRHGEIVQAIAMSIKKSEEIRNRTNLLGLSIQTISLLLRQLPDSDEKYRSLEVISRIKDEHLKNHDKINHLASRIKSIDSIDNNRTEALFILQSVETDWINLEISFNRIDEIVEKALAHINTKLTPA